MRSKWLKNLFQGAVLLGVPTWVSGWGIGMIPFNRLPLSHFWEVMVFRAVDVSFCLIFVGLLRPQLFKRFTLRMELKRAGISLGLIFVLVGRSVIGAQYAGHSFLDILSAVVFTMAIGVNEEIFSRVMIFGFFEQYGVWVAAAISSVHFGALHIGNAVWSDQSWGYTIGQAISAGAFGFMCCGFMLYTGSVWIPILLHGLSDLPFQFLTNAQYTSTTQASLDLVGLGLDLFVFLSVGGLLIYNSQAKLKKRVVSAGAYV